MSGELPSGTPLRQRQLAEMLHVSREPIKHAVRTLSNEGLVLKPPRRTAVVAPIRAKQVRDVYEVRTGLDAIAARTVCRLPVESRNVLCGLLSALIRQAAREREAFQLVELDRRFHLSIYEAAGNEVSLATFHSAWTIIGRAMSLLVSTNHQEKSWVEHAELIAAIMEGDVALAGRLSEEHCQSASDWLVKNAKHLMVDSIEPAAASGSEELTVEEVEGDQESGDGVVR